MTDWRYLVKIALVVAILEGALRRWVLPQASETIYFLKDVILLAAYTLYSLSKYETIMSRQSARLHGWLIVAAVPVLFQVMNLSLGSILVGLLGAKGYLLYIPLCFLVGNLFETIEELRSFLQWYLLLCIPVCLLGVVQFFAPADSFLNIYAASAFDIAAATFGEEGNVRVTGTFPYIVGFSTYLTLSLALLFALLAHQRRWFWYLASAIELTLITASLFMTGARAAMISAIVLVAGFTVFSIFERSFNRRLVWILAASIGVASYISIVFFPTAVNAFVNRTENSGDSVGDRMIGGFTEPYDALSQGHIWGYGTGSTQTACYALREQLHLGAPPASPPPSEMEPLRVALELGLVGLITWYGMRAYILCVLWRITWRLRHPMLRHLALAAFLMHALSIIGQVVTNTTFGVFYWFLSGFIFLLPKLDRRWMLRQRWPELQRPLLRKNVMLIPEAGCRKGQGISPVYLRF